MRREDVARLVREEHMKSADVDVAEEARGALARDEADDAALQSARGRRGW